MEWWDPIALKEIFTQILEKGDYIQISGGEPLLHPKVFEILYFIRTKKKWTYIEFQTNGVFLLQNNNLSNLFRFGVDLFNVNYPCHIQEVNDAIVGSKNTLLRREAWMRAILDKGWKLRINIIVNKLNYKYLGDMVEYLYKNFYGFEMIQMSFTKAMWAANKNAEIVPVYEEASPYFIEALERAYNLHIRVDIDHIPMCFLGKYFYQHVDYNKILSWEDGVFLEEKHFVEKCFNCDKKSVCSGYRDDYLQIYPYEKI